MLGFFVPTVYCNFCSDGGISNLLIIRKTGDVHGAVWHGKVTTVLLYSTMAIHLIWMNIPDAISYILIGACTAIILLSGILYGIQNVGFLKEKNHAEK